MWARVVAAEVAVRVSRKVLLSQEREVCGGRHSGACSWQCEKA